jgi:hypothetical protein
MNRAGGDRATVPHPLQMQKRLRRVGATSGYLSVSA